jgi:hypothetical protein
MSESDLDDLESYDHVRAVARDLGFYAQIHLNFNPLHAAPGREAACWYLQRSKKQNPTAAPHEPTIIKYKTAAEILEWLSEYRAQTQTQRGWGVSNQKSEKKERA